VRFLVTLGVRPDALTVLGAALFGGAAALFALGYVRLGGAGMLLAGILDALDGGVARESGSATRFGAFLDSTLDRLSESAVFVGIVYLYAASGRPAEALLAAAAMTFSLSTSYARARAEGLGVRCKVGLLERAGRIGILALSALAGLLPVGLALVALGAAVTTLQRILHVRRSTRDDETGRIAPPSRRAPKP
jgi:CDP-diacylglycerol--glycerol-3-phosphate 3-phosphatidyltransferase